MERGRHRIVGASSKGWDRASVYAQAGALAELGHSQMTADKKPRPEKIQTGPWRDANLQGNVPWRSAVSVSTTRNFKPIQLWNKRFRPKPSRFCGDAIEYL